jgi:hypothetical protein
VKRLNQILPILLAAALQVVPLLRTITISPAASSTFAIILRWGVGSTAALGAFDACSGASVAFGGPTNLIATAGAYYSNNIPIVNNTKTDPGGYFVLSNSFGNTANSPGPLLNGMTTTVCMPAGLTFKSVDPNNGNNPYKPMYGAIYGIPTTGVTNFRIKITAGHPSGSPISTNIYLTILLGSSPPAITNHPVSVTNVAGGDATFTVAAGGSSPLSYQWKFNNTIPLANATNATLSLTHIRSSQAGNYSVTITNAAGHTDSLAAALVVTPPSPPQIQAPTQTGGLFQFTLTPVVGLTNTVLSSSLVSDGVWEVFTNVPPPATSSPIPITEPLAGARRFYRAQIEP